MVHDFMKKHPSTVAGVDVFLLRGIMHNWSDKCAVRILRNLISAMKPGAKIIVNDVVISGPGTVPPLFERPLRRGNLMMDIYFNASDRELGEFAMFFEEASFDSGEDIIRRGRNCTSQRLRGEERATSTGKLMNILAHPCMLDTAHCI
jgi:hypothetical protein